MTFHDLCECVRRRRVARREWRRRLVAIAICMLFAVWRSPLSRLLLFTQNRQACGCENSRLVIRHTRWPAQPSHHFTHGASVSGLLSEGSGSHHHPPLAMALHGNDAYERKLRPLYDALDARSWKVGLALPRAANYCRHQPYKQPPASAPAAPYSKRPSWRMRPSKSTRGTSWCGPSKAMPCSDVAETTRRCRCACAAP
jgi:hypothetical protein